MYGDDRIGERVVAICNVDSKAKIVYLYGYGTYDGMVQMPADMIHPIIGMNEARTREAAMKTYEKQWGNQVAFCISEEYKEKMDKLMEAGEEINEKDKAWLELYEEERANPQIVNDEFIDRCVKSVRTNPRITLENGEVVWGAECWWGDPKIIDQYTEAGYTVETVEKE